MIESVKNWVLNIIVLAILIALLEIIIPSGKMKKYINLVSGIILIIAVINPLTGFLKRGVNLKELQISTSNYMDKREIEENSKMLEKRQMEQIAEVYRKKIISQLEEIAMEVEGIKNAEADVIINEDYTSSDFGEIKRAFLYLNMENIDNGIKPVTKVKRVLIGEGDSAKSSEKGNDEINKVDKAIRSQIEKKANRLLGIESDSLVISLQENRGDLDDKEDF